MIEKWPVVFQMWRVSYGAGGDALVLASLSLPLVPAVPASVRRIGGWMPSGVAPAAWSSASVAASGSAGRAAERQATAGTFAESASAADTLSSAAAP